MSPEKFFIFALAGAVIGLILGILVLIGILIPPYAAGAGLVLTGLFVTAASWQAKSLNEVIKPAAQFVVGMLGGVLITEYVVKIALVGALAVIGYLLSHA